MPTPRPAPARIAVPEAPVVRAVGGVARLTLVALLNPRTNLPAFAYAGRVGLAPTIRVRPGDRIVLDYVNDLPANDYAGNMTNLHFHGLVTAPVKPGDDTLHTMIFPGGHFRYVVRIGRTQEPGLYWYHPHAHGDTMRQVGLGGMSGAIVVDGLAARRPELRAMPERLLIVRDVMDDLATNSMLLHPADAPRDADAGGTNTPCAPIYGRHLEVDGEHALRLPAGDGRPQFVRLLNATGSRTLDLSIPGATTSLVALDGVALDAYPHGVRTQRFDHLVVPPASRIEFVVSGLRGGMTLHSACYDSGPDGDGDPAATLATFVDGGDAAPATLGSVDRGPLPAAGVLRHALPAAAAHRTIVLSETALNGATHFAVDGRPFRMGEKPLFIARSGTIEAWTIENRSREMHDFHVHQVHFVVTAIDGRAAPGPRLWRDTFAVPPATTSGGVTRPARVDVLVDFRDPVVRGEFVLHCHLLDHEDAGMMATIAVR